MKNQTIELLASAILWLGGDLCINAADTPQFRDLFNGRDLSGWVNVNTDPGTWSVRDGLLVCSGHTDEGMKIMNTALDHFPVGNAGMDGVHAAGPSASILSGF